MKRRGFLASLAGLFGAPAVSVGAVERFAERSRALNVEGRSFEFDSLLETRQFSGPITGISIVSNGSGYTQPPTLEITGGRGG